MQILFHLRKAFLLAVICGGTCVYGPSVSAQQKEEKTAIGAIADLIGRTLRAAVGNEEPADVDVEEMAVQAVELAAPEMAAGPAAAEVDQRQKRLNAYSEAMQHWITQVCDLTDEQRASLKTLAEADISKSQEKFANRDARQANEPLLDTFPVKFTIRYGAAQSLDLARQSRKLKEILSDEQLEKLKAASKDRTTYHFKAMLGRVLNLFDQELYLTEKQRSEMGELLARRLNGMESTSFSLFPQSYYYPQTALSFLLQRGAHLDVLSPAQQQRASDFVTDSGSNTSYTKEQYVSFQSTDGYENWYKQLDEVSEQQKARVHRACAVRNDFYRSQLQLNELQSRHLTVAAKGVADRLVAEWKKSTRQQLKTYEEQAGRFGGNFSFSMQVVNLQQIESDELWQYTVKQISKSSQRSADQYDRELAIRENTARYLASLFDKELWLLPEQRERMYLQILDALPATPIQGPYRTYMEEVSQLVIPMFKFSKRDLNLFDGPQKTAWEALRSEFDFNGRYVMVHMKNGGQFSFSIPR